VKGRAHGLWTRILEMHRRGSTPSPFVLARLILRTRVLPEEITPDIDDPSLEERLEAVMREVARAS
jgi:hypothetical protein